VLVDRSGSVTDVGGSYEQYTEIAAVPGGAIIVWSDFPSEDAPIAHLAIVQAGGFREIWQYQPDMENGYSFLDLMWTPDVEAGGGLAPFTPVQ
jgi:hypothetical protein